MKHIALLMLLNAAIYKPETLSNLRTLFLSSYTDKKSFEKLENQTSNIQLNDQAALMGYKAMAEIMKCRYVLSPIEKLLHFNRGKKILEAAIEKEPYCTELRYLRYVVQCNAPTILGYSGNKKEDKKILLDFVSRKQGMKCEQDELYNMVVNAIKK